MVDITQDTSMKIFENAKQGHNSVIYEQELHRKDILSILGPYEYRLCHVHKWRVVPLSLVRSNLQASGEDKLSEEQVLGQVRPWSEICIDRALTWYNR